MSQLPVAPFDSSRYVGTVCHVRPTTVDVNLPWASAPSGSHFAGYTISAGLVGEFLVIEGEEHAVLGRVVEVRLPERERLTVEPTSEVDAEANPVGIVQLLTAIELATGRTLKGVPAHPRIGQHVFSAHPLLVKQAVEQGTANDQQKVQLAVFPHAHNTRVSLPPAHIFGRHCAVLGATGGGKSWTLARLVEEVERLGGKAILFDASGEFETQCGAVTHAHLGGRPDSPADTRQFVSFPYWDLTESDLFALFRPSAGAQAPKLREALRSLKLAHIDPALTNGAGLVCKANRPKAAFEAAVGAHTLILSAPGAEFNIALLPAQILEECVFPTGPGGNPAQWGGPANNDASFCTTLVSRIEADIVAAHMACIYQPGGLETVPDLVERFLADPDQRVLRVSMEFLPFEHNTRELVANAVGRYLLGLARSGRFKEQPLVVMLDEAHQFLDKAIGDEYLRVPLDSFGLIAKEGRKYGLTCVLATQRPRDIPEDVLSQMGMFIVHRLINERDRNVVEKACGNLDAAAAAFLPTLGQGEALVVGVDSPMPLPVMIRAPRYRPESHGPDYARCWSTVD